MHYYRHASRLPHPLLCLLLMRLVDLRVDCDEPRPRTNTRPQHKLPIHYGIREVGGRNKSSTKLLRVELCIGIRVLCMLNAYSCAYAIQAATGQVVWPRLDSCMPCTCICHACRYRAVTRATWRHAPVHAHVHEQCSSSLRGLDICISRKRDIT